MKRHLLATLTVLSAVASGSSPLTAQVADAAEPLLVAFVGGGLARGVGDLSTDTGNGWLVLGGVDAPLAQLHPGLGIGVSGSFSQIPYGGGFGEATQVTAVALEASYRIGDAGAMVRPFVRAGGGVQFHRYDPGDLAVPARTDMRPALSAAAGAAIRMGMADALVGARLGSGTDAGFVGLWAGVSVPVGSSR